MLLAVSFLALSSNGRAQEVSLARLIWDLGRDAVYLPLLKEQLEESQVDEWRLPPRDQNGVPVGYRPMLDGEKFLETGDYVRVYLTNYNPISHTPETARVTVVEMETPVITSLSSGLVALLSAGVSSPLESAFTVGDVPEDAKTCKDATNAEGLSGCLDYITLRIRGGNRVDSLYSAVERLKPQFTFQKIDGVKRIVDAFPNDAWGVHDREAVAAQLAAALNAQTMPLGSDDPTDSYAELVAHVEREGGRFASVTKTIGTLFGLFDLALAAADSLPADDRAELTRRRARLKAEFDLLREEPKSKLSSFKASLETLCEYDRKLTLMYESDFAADVSPTAQVKENTLVLIEAPLKSTDATEPKKLRYQLALRVADHYPHFFASAGILFAVPSFDFQKHKFLDLPVAPNPDDEEPAPSFQRTLSMEPTNTHEPISGALLSHFGKRVYFTVGTTVDKNIFKNLILGGTYYVPRYRLVLTGGVIGARGATEQDLADIQGRYIFEGKIVNGLVLANIPSGERWHWSGLFAITFKPF